MAAGRLLHQERRETDRRAEDVVIIPAQGAVFVLELDADAADSDHDVLMDAVNIIDDQTTIAAT